MIFGDYLYNMKRKNKQSLVIVTKTICSMLEIVNSKFILGVTYRHLKLSNLDLYLI
jgi:hypothetical protein